MFHVGFVVLRFFRMTHMSLGIFYFQNKMEIYLAQSDVQFTEKATLHITLIVRWHYYFQESRCNISLELLAFRTDQKLTKANNEKIVACTSVHEDSLFHDNKSDIRDECWLWLISDLTLWLPGDTRGPTVGGAEILRTITKGWTALRRSIRDISGLKFGL